MNFVPERLRELRILNGHTTEMTAKRIGVTKQAVSKYESGKAIPATDVIMRILELYGIQLEYLTNKRGLPDDRSVVFYRKLNRTTQKEMQEAEVYLKWFYEIIITIGRIYPIKTVNLPEMPSHYSIKEKAERLREYWNLGDHAISDITTLLEAHGFFLFTSDLQGKRIDGYSQMIGNVPIIVLNREKGTKERRQFSISHELGHLILHRHADQLTEQMEEEADEFAGCFLMPERAITSALIRLNADFFLKLAEKWYVSPHALAERCYNLQLLGDNTMENDAKKASLYQSFNRKAKSVSVAEMDCSTISSVRTALCHIAADEKTARIFLKELCFPVREIQRLCCLTDEFTRYEQLDNKKGIDEIDGVQLSFLFNNEKTGE